jgi:hypothetical protein
MKELGLEHIAHSKVGSAANRGISGGELKRVAIALELVSSPSLLFLVRLIYPPPPPLFLARQLLMSRMHALGRTHVGPGQPRCHQPGVDAQGTSTRVCCASSL